MATTQAQPETEQVARGEGARILVTGGTGFVGPKIVHALRARDLPVRCLVRTPAKAKQLEAWGCELVQGDVTDPETLRRAVAGCDTVVHLVAILQGKPEDFERIMVQGTRNVVAAAKEAGVRRFVLMSALGTSEQTKDIAPYYGAKWEMEQEVERSGLTYTMFLPSFVFGRDGGILPIFLRIVRLAPVIPVVGSGHQRVQPIWIEDVAEHFARSVDLAAAENRKFELGGPDVVTWDELYDRIARALGKRRRKLHVPMGLVRVNAAVFEKLPFRGRKPVTRNELDMLAGPDNVISNDDAQRTFGIELIPLDEQIRRGSS